MRNNNYRLIERIKAEQGSELEALNSSIANHYANIENKNKISQIWESYKAAKHSDFLSFIRGIPESVKAEINFEELKVNLGLDLIL